MISLNFSDDDNISLRSQSLVGQINTVSCRFGRLDSIIIIIIIIITTTIVIVLSSTAPAICESSLWFLWAKVGQRYGWPPTRRPSCKLDL